MNLLESCGIFKLAVRSWLPLIFRYMDRFLLLFFFYAGCTLVLQVLLYHVCLRDYSMVFRVKIKVTVIALPDLCSPDCLLAPVWRAFMPPRFRELL